MARGLNVFVNIGARVGSSLNTAARQTERRFQQVGRSARLAAAEAKAAWRGMERNFSTFNSHVAMPAAALSGLGARAAYEWSKVGNELQAVTQMSDAARKKIEAVARSMPGNPADNLRAALDLARTGFDAKAIMGSLGVTIKLGKADSSVDQAEAADIMTNVMKGMKMPDDTFKQIVASSERVANNIAYGAARSSSDVRLMGESFKYAAPMAARMGIEIEDLTGYFMTMADNGIKGSEAGVALRSGLVRLVKPTKGAMAVLARHNMHLEDYIKFSKRASADDIVKTLSAQGLNAEGARGAIAALLADDKLTGAPLIAKISEAVAEGAGSGADAMDLDKISDGVMMAMTSGVSKIDFAKFIQDGVTKGWSASEFSNFFDVRQGTRLSTLWSADMVRNINMVKAAMRIKQGKGSFLDQMYATQMKGAVGPWERMKQGFGNVIISMAESGVMDTVANGMNRLADGLMSLSKANPGMLKFITYAILGVGTLAPLGFALAGIGAGLRIAFGGFQLATLALGPLVTLGPMLLNGLAALAPFVIKGLVAAFALLSNPIGWAVIIGGVAAAMVYYFRDDIARQWPKVVAWFKGAWESIKNYAMSINWSGVGMKIADSLTFGLASKGLNFAAGVGAKLSGKRAKGGPVRAGGSYLVGEQGPEVVTFGRNGHVTPNHHLAGLGGGRGVSIGTLNINGSGLSQAELMAAVHGALNRLANGQAALLSD